MLTAATTKYRPRSARAVEISGVVLALNDIVLSDVQGFLASRWYGAITIMA